MNWEKLSPEALDAKAAAEPRAALAYAAELLTPKRRKQCRAAIDKAEEDR